MTDANEVAEAGERVPKQKKMRNTYTHKRVHSAISYCLKQPVQIKNDQQCKQL